MLFTNLGKSFLCLLKGVLTIYRGNFTATRPQSIGWKPEWNKERFLKNVDVEIEDVIELGKAKSSLIDSLFAATMMHCSAVKAYSTY